ncbi:MAG: DNA polymerase III subunit delta [Alphaproteobacteria bacterium]
MKIEPRRADGFCARPPASLRLALVYGPDRGLARERAEALARAVVTDPADPFRLADLAPEAIAKDLALLADEAGAFAFGGGRRVVRVRDAGDGIAGAVENLLALGACDALVVIEAGELGARSALRKLAEGADAAAAIACYHDEGAGLARLIADALAEHGLEADAAASEELALSLGGDRLATRAEIAKLATYMGGSGRVGRADVEAVVGDAGQATLDEVAFAAGAGTQAALERALARAFGQGENEVAVLRAAIRHVMLLHLVMVRAGTGGLERALASLRPPPHFRVRDALLAQARLWSVARLGAALGLLLDAEIAVKTTGNPQRVIVRRALYDLARFARRS